MLKRVCTRLLFPLVDPCTGKGTGEHPLERKLHAMQTFQEMHAEVMQVHMSLGT